MKPLWALGMMSGTSMDGIDAALLKTDGTHVLEQGDGLFFPYAMELRGRIREALAGKGDEAALARELTLLHAEAAKALIQETGVTPDLIGFHGQTILHKPKEGVTVQLGDGALLAAETGVDVICDFRSEDVRAGGEGAPLVPLFHRAMVEGKAGPCVLLNIGGVANVTWIGGEGILAFDTGPGNALLDDWVHRHTGEPCDLDGALAAKGKANQEALGRFLQDPFFHLAPPKSLDRNHFSKFSLEGLSVEDGAATLAAFTVEAVRAGCRFFPEQPKQWWVTGGGRHHPRMMALLRDTFGKVAPVEDLGWSGDLVEAYAFAFLAVRSRYGLPLTLPTTTGVKSPMTGGRLHLKRA